MKKILFLLIFVSGIFSANAQLVDVINEVHFASGGIADVPAGYTTYRIYARMQDATDRISAVFGSTSPSPTHHLHIYSSSAANAIYNAPATGTLGTDNNCAFWGFPGFGGMPYDSYVTFQATDAPTDPCPQCSPTGTIFQISAPAGIIPATLGGPSMGPDMTMVDGSWFIPNDGSCYGFPTGADNRILITQITVPTGTLEYWLNIAVFNEAVGADQLIYVHTQQDDTEFVGFIPELDGNCMGLVYPTPFECYCDLPACIDPSACNYDSMAMCDDGSCTYPGCTDFAACNYNPNAGCDDGSCETAGCGCLDPLACNYVEDATIAVTCYYPGCLDYTACNYEPAAGCDSGGCTYPGCNNPAACNYEVNAGCTNNSCVFPGCTNPTACNYNVAAGCDDGSCIVNTISGYVFNDANGDGIWQQGGFDEPGMFNRQILIEPIGLLVFTDFNGFYEIGNLAPGDYTVSVIDNDDVWEITTPVELNVTMPGCDDDVNFGLTPSNNTAFWLQGPCCIWSMNIHCTNGINPGLWVHNSGPVPLQGEVTVSHNTAMTAVPLGGITVNPTAIDPGLVTWAFDNQLSGQSKLYQCHLNGPGVDYIGQVLPIDITLTLWDDDDVVFYTNTWTLTPTVVCAYDPNDKYAEPMGYTDENHFILNGTDIEYRIRFQNTGNFVAEDVEISDQLNLEVLDITTFEPLYASANYMACLHPEGMVDFIFNDIMLPDSSSDFAGSQGFVVFRISTLPGLNPGTIINNTAAIFFDDNPPVITNTMWHTIYDCDGVAEITSNGSPACFGEPITLNATEEFMETTEWFEGEILVNEAGEFVPLISSDGIFEYTLQTSNPICEEEGMIEIVVNPLAQIDAGNDVEVCDGESVLLNATGSDEIEWSNGSANNSTYIPTGNEILTASGTSEFGCEGSDEITITIHPLPGIEVTQNGAMFTAPDGASWQWYNSDGMIGGETSQSFTAEEDGTYWCVVTNEFDCTSTTEQIAFIGISETVVADIVLFPNPMHESAVLVLSPAYINSTLSITDSEGRVVKNLGLVTSNQITIERSSLAAGTYFITLERNGVPLKQVRLILH